MLMRRLLSLLVLITIVFFINCSYKPPDNPNERPGEGFNVFPGWYDNMLGEQHAEIYRKELPILTSPLVQKNVQDLGSYLVRSYYGEERAPFRFDFHVVNLDVMNAFALPGGKIFVFRGLMEDVESESELAGVLSHEIGHVVARHGTKNISRSLAYQSLLAAGAAVVGQTNEDLASYAYLAGNIGLSLSLLKHSRDYEREADWIGLHNIYKANYNPQGMVTVFQRFEQETKEKGQPPALFLQSHPAPEERQKNVLKELAKIDLNREWTQERFNFSAVRAELKALPPAPKEIAGRAVRGMNSLESMGQMIAQSRMQRLQSELATTNTQTVRIFIPSNEDWIDTQINLLPGQVLELKVESNEITNTTGPSSNRFGAEPTKYKCIGNQRFTKCRNFTALPIICGR